MSISLFRKHFFQMALSVLLMAFFVIPAKAERSISPAYQIFNQSQNAVVTVINGAGHGSGFIVGKDGVILTNHHVVYPNIGSKLIVRIKDDNYIAELVESNPKLDIAVLKVSPTIVKEIKPLELFNPQNATDLTSRGEEVIAIGSPVDWKALEKTLTRGIVSNQNEFMIFHDAALNGGNSGGPLLNFEGKVVGINSIGVSDRGQAIAGTVKSTHIDDFIKSVKSKLANQQGLSIKLPAYPLKRLPMELIAKENPSYFSTESTFLTFEKRVNFDKFTVQLKTPVEDFRKFLIAEALLLKQQQNRFAKAGKSIDNNELFNTRENRVYDSSSYGKYITIRVNSKKVLTTSSKINLVLGAVGGVTPIINTTYEGDFKNFSLVDALGNPLCQPYIFGRNEELAVNPVITDRSYQGHFEYPFECFIGRSEIYLLIEDEQGQLEKHLLNKRLLTAIQTEIQLLQRY